MDNLKIPTHLAIILDGNGRWAKAKGLPRSFGHKAGANALKNTVRNAYNYKVKYLSVYCFSTENWKRAQDEIKFLFTLPTIYFNKYLKDLIKKDIKVVFSGDLSKLPEETLNICNKASSLTKNCKTMVFNICLNYGSHDEIIHAIKEIALDVKNNKLDIDSIDSKIVDSHMYVDLPPIDLLIRTSKELRLSNFMLWQMSYAEMYFPTCCWPDFNKQELTKAFIEYTKRDRRFGDAK